jgi:hypothetical protein
VCRFPLLTHYTRYYTCILGDGRGRRYRPRPFPQQPFQRNGSPVQERFYTRSTRRQDHSTRDRANYTRDTRCQARQAGEAQP